MSDYSTSAPQLGVAKVISNIRRYRKVPSRTKARKWERKSGEKEESVKAALEHYLTTND